MTPEQRTRPRDGQCHHDFATVSCPVHRSVRQLNVSIRAWITNWNDPPKPFVWHKTADEIIDRLAANC